MKVLFVTSGWPTHFYLVAPLAWAFRVRGHEVRVAVPPSGVATVTGAGLPAVQVGRDIDFMEIRRQTLSHELSDERPETFEELTERFASDGGDGGVLDLWQDASFAATEDLVRLARRWRPDLVIADTMSIGGLVAAHVVGVPAIRHLLATDILGSVDGEGLLDILPGFREHFAQYGVALSGDPAHLTLDPCPPSMQHPPAPSRRQIRFVPYNGTATVPRWLREPPTRPRVCVTWGTTSAWSAGENKFVVPEILEVLGELDVEIIVTLGAGQHRFLGETPPGVRVLEGLPLHLLMPTTAVLINQGGSSSILTGARYAVPQLCVAYLPEQVNDGEAYASTGAGICLHVEKADAETHRQAVGSLLGDPSFRRAAERVRDEMTRQPSLAETVSMLEDLCGRSAG